VTLLPLLLPDGLRQDHVVRRRLSLRFRNRFRRRQDFQLPAEAPTTPVGVGVSLVATAEVVVTTKESEVVLVVGGGRQVVDAREAFPEMLMVGHHSVGARRHVRRR